MTDTLKKVAQGLGAIALGEMVGFISESLSSKIWQARTQVGISEIEANSFFDYTLDALINITFLILGTSMVEKALPEVTEDLHSNILFLMGLLYSQTRLPSDMKAIMQKLTSNAPTSPAAVAAPVS